MASSSMSSDIEVTPLLSSHEAVEVTPAGKPSLHSITSTTNTDEWGSIEAVLTEPLNDTTFEESWWGVIFLLLFFPFNALMSLMIGLCQCLFAKFGLISFYAAKANFPWYKLPAVWWWWVSTAITLFRLGHSRLRLFMWEKEAFGDKDYWFHARGIWCWRYAEVDEMLKNTQFRSRGFGAGLAPTPDLFPPRALIFLANDGPNSEWAAIRSALHTVMLKQGPDLEARLKGLRDLIAEEWPAPKLADTANKTLMLERVCKLSFYLLTGVKVDKDDLDVLTAWPSALGYWVFPRLSHRVFFNLLKGKVQRTRRDLVKLIEKHNLQHIFIEMNKLLPPEYRRQPAVRLCDEISFIIGFAGLGGTSSAAMSIGAFLRAEFPEGSAKDNINFAEYQSTAAMEAAYRKNPESFIRETLRMDPPVTSATSTFDQDTSLELYGQTVIVPKGMFKQYTVSISNRDPSVFPQPEVFDPTRSNLHKALTWNGAFGSASDDEVYPRICPGRHLSLAVLRAVFDHLFQM